MYQRIKLDVEQKTRSNPFAWRGQFTPELIEYFLKTHYHPGMFIADPFSGSGTLLYEALKFDANAVACELNPSAYAMSKFFELGNISVEDRQKLCQNLKTNNSPTEFQASQSVFNPAEKDYRKAYYSLINFAKDAINSCNSKKEIVLLLNVIFKMEGHKKKKIGQSWEKAFFEISEFLYSLPESNSKVFSYLSDARMFDKKAPKSVDLVITSPPYINVFNYHQNHRIIMELFDFDMLEIARSEFGSNRKNRGNRYLTVIQYCIDMAQALNSIKKTLNPNAELIMIVGRESNVKKTPFYNGNIIEDIATKTGLFVLKHRTERCFLNKFGKKIFEDVLLLHPNIGCQNIENISRNIASDHLKNAFIIAPSESKNDLIQAIEAIDTVDHSPIFQYRKKNE